MLARYESTKPAEQQVAAAVKQRNRTKAHRGATKSTNSSSRNSSDRDSAIFDAPGANRARRRSSSHPLPTAASSSIALPRRRSSNDDSSKPTRPRRASHTPLDRPLQLQSLDPIAESAFEDVVTSDDDDDDDDDDDTDGTATSSSSTSSQTVATAPLQQLPSPPHRHSFSMRKLLRDVLGRDGGVWTSDQHVVRHYAHLQWSIVPIQADGNCLFRAISDQLYGNEKYHSDIRRRIVAFIERKSTLFEPFLATSDATTAETLAHYCQRMQCDGAWGGNLELFAAATLFNVHIIVHQGPNRRVCIESGGRESDAVATTTKHKQTPYKIVHLLFKSDHYMSLRPLSNPENHTKDSSRSRPSMRFRSYRRRSSPSLPPAPKQQLVRPAAPAEHQQQHQQQQAHRPPDKDAAIAPVDPIDSVVVDAPPIATESVEAVAGTRASTTTTTAGATKAMMRHVRHKVAYDDFGDALRIPLYMTKPTRVVFRRGKPSRFAAHVSSSASTASSTDSTSATTTVSESSIASTTSSNADALIATVEDVAAVATATTTAMDDDDDDALTLAFPTHRTFPRSSSSSSSDASQRQQQQHLTAAY